MNEAPPLRLTKHGSPPGLPHEPLTPEKQLKAIRLVQEQAEQRVNLGMQLFKAAQAHTSHQQELVEEVKTHQEQMRHEMQNDIASSLYTYDQWMAKFDENFTHKIHQLEEKLDQRIAAINEKWETTEKHLVELARQSKTLLDQKINALNEKWEATQKRILEMARRSETLLDKSRRMLKAAAQQPAVTTRRTKPPSKPATPPTAYSIVVPATQKFLPRPKSINTPTRKTKPKTTAKKTPQTSPVTAGTLTANGVDDQPAGIFDYADTPPIQNTPPPTQANVPSPNDALEQPDRIFCKALELLNADQAMNAPLDD